MTELKDSLLDRIMLLMMQNDVPGLPEWRIKLQVILEDYKIEAKEEALTVWTEGKNELFFKRFLLAKAVSGCTQRTLQFYDSTLRYIFNQLDKDVDMVSSVDIQLFLGTLMQRGLKRTSISNHYRVLSTFYNWCSAAELIERNPMNKVDTFRARREKKPAFTDLDVEKIRNACRSSREKAIVEILLSTGCRVTELIGIKLADIKENQIKVFGKGEKYRNVYLNAKAQLALQIYLSERSDKNPYLFPRMISIKQINHKGFKKSAFVNWYKDPNLVDADLPMVADSVEEIVRKLGELAAVANVHPHRFRRTCATFALRRGMPIEQVSQMLGHEQISTTQIYLDLDESDLERAHVKYVV